MELDTFSYDLAQMKCSDGTTIIDLLAKYRKKKKIRTLDIIIRPSHEIMVLFVLHTLQTCIRSHPVGFVTKWIKSCLLQCFGTFKMPILMFICVLVFRPEGQIWNPVRRDTRIYVRRILNASRISKTQLNSYTISPSYKENVRFSTVDFHKLKWSRKWNFQ